MGFPTPNPIKWLAVIALRVVPKRSIAPLGLHFGSNNTSKISIAYGDLSRNSVFFWTEVKPNRTVLHKGSKCFLELVVQRGHGFNVFLQGWGDEWRVSTWDIVSGMRYSDRDKSWPIILGKSHSKSVKTYPGHCMNPPNFWHHSATCWSPP